MLACHRPWKIYLKAIDIGWMIPKAFLFKGERTLKYSLAPACIASLLFTQTLVQAESIKISPLDRDLEDVGCTYRRRNDNPRVNPLFVSDSTGIWMNINDQKIALTDLSEADNDRYQEYKSGNILIRIYSGKYRQHEGGVSYPKAKMTVTIGDKTETVKLKGGCAC